jgi:hypothetical protein
MVTDEKLYGKLLFEEKTNKHFDDLILKRRGRRKKEGNVFAYFIMGIMLFCILLLIFMPKKPELNNRNGLIFFYILISFPIIYFLYALKSIITMDSLKIYELGISLPNRSLIEWIHKKEHFIPFKIIKEIHFNQRIIWSKPVKIIKMNGEIEKVYRNYFGDIRKIIKIVGQKVVINL